MRIKHIVIPAIMLLMSACGKNLDVKPWSFEVSSAKMNGTASTSFTIADTVNFLVSGTPDVITFYSGEVGKRYEFKDRTSAAGTPELQFTSLRANGTQANSLALLISTDFKGVVAKSRLINGLVTTDTTATNANIASAGWDDITSRATLPTGTTAVASGVINLSDYAEKGKPVYIAFKYLAVAGSIQNKWTINGLTIKNTLPDQTSYTIANLTAPATGAITNYGNANTYSPGWAVSYDLAKNANKYAWVFTANASTGSLVITGATTVPTATAGAEAWAIMGPLDLRKVAPDAGIPIKAITARATDIINKYAVSGAYNAVFVASSNSADQTSSQVKQLSINITP